MTSSATTCTFTWNPVLSRGSATASNCGGTLGYQSETSRQDGDTFTLGTELRYLF